jgi:anti-sigma regulatory factor (Ser/Thr protein kinase)
MTADEITITLPVEEEFQRIAHLVLGGLAVRLDLTFEHLEDMQLALEGLLERRGAESVTVVVVVDDGKLRTSVGPFAEAALEDLERDDAPLGLRRVLETVVDSFEVEQRDGERWVRLTKATK